MCVQTCVYRHVRSRFCHTSAVYGVLVPDRLPPRAIKRVRVWPTTVHDGPRRPTTVQDGPRRPTTAHDSAHCSVGPCRRLEVSLAGRSSPTRDNGPSPQLNLVVVPRTETINSPRHAANLVQSSFATNLWSQFQRAEAILGMETVLGMRRIVVLIAPTLATMRLSITCV